MSLVLIKNIKIKKGQAAAFKTKARGSMINLLSAMSEEGMIYFELLNEDRKKKTGTSAINIYNFLIWLKDHCPNGSIIVMDNARIHGGDNFKKVPSLLIE